MQPSIIGVVAALVGLCGFEKIGFGGGQREEKDRLLFAQAQMFERQAAFETIQGPAEAVGIVERLPFSSRQLPCS